jgi:phosphoribosyl-ATP pyrophosphohydrolase
MKTFEELWVELGQKIQAGNPDSETFALVNSGVHAIGKKIMEEAGEVWIAAEYQSNSELALEISQLLYYLQVLAKTRGVTLEEIYREL